MLNALIMERKEHRRDCCSDLEQVITLPSVNILACFIFIGESRNYPMSMLDQRTPLMIRCFMLPCIKKAVLLQLFFRRFGLSTSSIRGVRFQPRSNRTCRFQEGCIDDVSC